MRPSDAPPTAPEFLRTDPRQRLRLALLTTVMVAVVALFLIYGLPVLTAWVRAGNTAAVLHKLGVVCTVLGALQLVAAAWTAVYARRVFRSGQFPPPGTWVFRDTRLRRGAVARARGWGVVAGATCCILLALYAFALPYRLQQRLLPPVPGNGAPLQSPH